MMNKGPTTTAQIIIDLKSRKRSHNQNERRVEVRANQNSVERKSGSNQTK